MLQPRKSLFMTTGYSKETHLTQTTTLPSRTSTRGSMPGSGSSSALSHLSSTPSSYSFRSCITCIDHILVKISEIMMMQDKKTNTHSYSTRRGWGAVTSSPNILISFPSSSSVQDTSNARLVGWCVTLTGSTRCAARSSMSTIWSWDAYQEWEMSFFVPSDVMNKSTSTG